MSIFNWFKKKTVEQIAPVTRPAPRRLAVDDPTICPCCGNKGKLVDGEDLFPYISAAYGESYWQCKPCDCVVGCHPGSDRPLGIMANKATRNLRRVARKEFDSLWNMETDRKKARIRAYDWLAKELNIDRRDCVFAMFDEQLCNQAIGLIYDRDATKRLWAVK